MLKIPSAHVAWLALAVFSLSSSSVGCSSSSGSPSDGSAGAGGNAGSDAATGGDSSAAGSAGGSAGSTGGAGGAVADAGTEGDAASQVGDAGPAVAIAKGPTLDMASAVCGIIKSGAAYCWGFGANGETGSTVGSSLVPVAVDGGLTFTTISTYGGHTCALTTAGAAYCWGNGDLGALGDGKTDGHLAKAPVAVTGGLTFAAITVGDNFTCALTSDGSAYCWGDNRTGQLGLGAADAVKRGVPTKMPTFKWRSISARDTVACGITVEGAPYCWGSNAGVAGTGGPLAATLATPTAVPGGVSLKAVVTASPDHACGLAEDGRAFCWGNATLGDGMPGGAAALGETLVAGGHTFTQLAAARNTFCGVTSAGETYCWGGPFPSSPTLTFQGIAAASVATRGLATCVLSSAGAASCLGTNALGELGDGTNTPHATAAPVSGALMFMLP
jgi:alpha-tubulin suppressor-like RCC1 family protein